MENHPEKKSTGVTERVQKEIGSDLKSPLLENVPENLDALHSLATSNDFLKSSESIRNCLHDVQGECNPNAKDKDITGIFSAFNARKDAATVSHSSSFDADILI